MFKNRPYDRSSTLDSKSRLRIAAKREWPFLPDGQLAKVETEDQLADLVQVRSGRTRAEAAPLVRDWMERTGIPPTFGPSRQTRKAEPDWESEGGSS